MCDHQSLCHLPLIESVPTLTRLKVTSWYPPCGVPAEQGVYGGAVLYSTFCLAPGPTTVLEFSCIKVTRRPREGPAHERCQHHQMARRRGSLGAPSLPSSCILSSQLWLAPQFVLVTACLFSGPISRAFHSRRCSVPSPRCTDTSSGLGILPLSSLPRGHVHRSCSLLSCALEPGGVGWG